VETSHATGFAGLRPLLERHRERVLERLLRHVHVAQQADQRGQDPPMLRPENLLDAQVHWWKGYSTRQPRARDREP
jgi:hypothetical protein